MEKKTHRLDGDLWLVCSFFSAQKRIVQSVLSFHPHTAHNATEDEIIAFLMDRNLPADDILLSQIARKILTHPLVQGYLTISNALQWRLQYGRIVDLKASVSGITKIVEKE